MEGFILVDEPLKPCDALSEEQHKKVSERFNKTLKARLDAPAIIILGPTVKA